MISTLTQRLPDPRGGTSLPGTEFDVIGHNNIYGTSPPPTHPFLRISVHKVANSQCEIPDNGADYCLKIPEMGHFIEEVITLCKFGSKEMTIHWIIH